MMRTRSLASLFGSWPSTILLVVACGCSTGPLADREPQAELAPVIRNRDYETVDDLAKPLEFHPLELKGIGLASGLDGTGIDPPDSPERRYLLDEMRQHKVQQAARYLASPNYSLVQVRGIVPPGAQEGDRFDLEITLPANVGTTDLQHGWVLPTDLRESAVLNDKFVYGHMLARGAGRILTDALMESGDDPALRRRGRILGGGRLHQTRDLGLRMREGHRSVRTSAAIANAINQRFHVRQNGLKTGVAQAKKDTYVNLQVHPAYFDNVTRYMRVVQSIVVGKLEGEKLTRRLTTLKSRLSRPGTASLAAIQLEAIGEDGMETLRQAVRSPNEEVRFYAAESLAYLNSSDAIDILAAVIREEPAFRARALIALGAMNQARSHEALLALLDEQSAEVRYGAFRELRQILPKDPSIAGELLNEDFHFHRVNSNGRPLLHVSKYDRPEIVVFGSDLRLEGKFVLFAGKQVVVRGDEGTQVRIRKLSAIADDEELTISNSVDDVIRAVATLKCTYPDVVQLLTEAHRTGALSGRLAFSALPEHGRTYERELSPSGDSEDGIAPGDPEASTWEGDGPGRTAPITDLTASQSSFTEYPSLAADDGTTVPDALAARPRVEPTGDPLSPPNPPMDIVDDTALPEAFDHGGIGLEATDLPTVDDPDPPTGLNRVAEDDEQLPIDLDAYLDAEVDALLRQTEP